MSRSADEHPASEAEPRSTKQMPLIGKPENRVPASRTNPPPADDHSIVGQDARLSHRTKVRAVTRLRPFTLAPGLIRSPSAISLVEGPVVPGIRGSESPRLVTHVDEAKVEPRTAVLPEPPRPSARE